MVAASSVQQPPLRWLLLIHQLPPSPAYLRVKIGRRLARVAAVALKNSVYVLPRSEATAEDFQWIRREILEGGGEATIVEAQLVDGLSDTEVEALFKRERDAEYAEVTQHAKRLARGPRGKPSPERLQELETELGRLERRLAEIAALDYFGASGREAAAAALRAVRERMLPAGGRAITRAELDLATYRGRTWVTRAGIFVDRIASAWLIRRFIDPAAQFKFVSARGYVPEAGELRFDMFEAEFGHEQEQCTFEVLCSKMQLRQPGLRAIAEAIHDIDIKDSKFGRPETPGIAALLTGLTLCHRDDQQRLEQGCQLFDQLLAFYGRRKAEATGEVEITRRKRKR